MPGLGSVKHPSSILCWHWALVGLHGFKIELIWVCYWFEIINFSFQDKHAQSRHIKTLAEWLQRRRGSHFSFAVLCSVMDIIYMLQLVCQILVINSILEGNFLTYGTLRDTKNVFPHKIHCTYEETYEETTLKIYAICYLNLNNIASYATLFLWYWLLALTVLTVLLLVFDIFYVTNENLRIRILEYNSGKFVDRRHIKHVLRGLSKTERFGEVVFLNILVQNLDHIMCNELYNFLWMWNYRIENKYGE